MKNHALRVGTGILALLATTPALSQDGSEMATGRTPASAQKFIQALPPAQLGYWPTPTKESWWLKRDEISSPEACKTVFHGAKANISASGIQWERLPNGSSYSATINWSKVEEVTSSAANGEFFVSLKTPGDEISPVYNLLFESQQSRDRVLAAAQYLKDACDQSKGLGF